MRLFEAVSRDWPWFLGAAGVAAVVGLVISRGEPVGTWREPTPPPPPAPRGRLEGETIHAFPGRTYFAAVEANGSVGAAANVARIEEFARKQGFRDVLVLEADDAFSHWPVSNEDADYYVRGTFGGPEPKGFARETDVFLGSAKLLDVVEV